MPVIAFLTLPSRVLTPVELGVLHTGTPTPGDVAVMDVEGCVEGSETPEAVADDMAPRGNSLVGVATDLGEGEAAHAEKLNTQWVAFLIGRHEWELVLSAAPALSRSLRPESFSPWLRSCMTCSSLCLSFQAVL